MTRAAIYARVSTRDKGQDPELQLVPLRDYVHRRGLEPGGEYVDQASAGDQARRVEWRALLESARRREFDLLLVWRLDRAFRSTLDALTTLQQLEHAGVGFMSLSQPELDTTSPAGRLMFTVLAAAAELERALLGERVREGMAAAKARGKVLGRPRASADPRVRRRWRAIAEKVAAGELTRAQAAKNLRVSRATVRELIRESNGGE